MRFQYNDGGRSQAGYKGKSGDCACRSIAIVSGLPYQEVYNLISKFAQNERTSKKKKGKSNPRTGVYIRTIRKVMESIGFIWVPTMLVGSGCKVHLKEDEIPKGRVMVSLSRHISAVLDGVINDTHDPSRQGTRCVYGYWIRPEETLT